MGDPELLQDVDERRPDPTHYEIIRIFNNGISYLDAAQVQFELPRLHGLLLHASHTFSKAIDTGADYAHTAANRDATIITRRIDGVAHRYSLALDRIIAGSAEDIDLQNGDMIYVPERPF